MEWAGRLELGARIDWLVRAAERGPRANCARESEWELNPSVSGEEHNNLGRRTSRHAKPTKPNRTKPKCVRTRVNGPLGGGPKWQ